MAPAPSFEEFHHQIPPIMAKITKIPDQSSPDLSLMSRPRLLSEHIAVNPFKGSRGGGADVRAISERAAPPQAGEEGQQAEPAGTALR